MFVEPAMADTTVRLPRHTRHVMSMAPRRLTFARAFGGATSQCPVLKQMLGYTSSNGGLYQPNCADTPLRPWLHSIGVDGELAHWLSCTPVFSACPTMRCPPIERGVINVDRTARSVSFPARLRLERRPPAPARHCPRARGSGAVRG